MKRYILKVDNRYEESCDALNDRLAASNQMEEVTEQIRRDEEAAAVPSPSFRSRIQSIIPERLLAFFI